MSHDTYDRLPSIDMPVLIVGGKYDGISPPKNLKAIHEMIPESKLEFFEGGHMFAFQDPRAWKVITEFLLENE
jgi:3-oxoadipate enol-lactonase